MRYDWFLVSSQWSTCRSVAQTLAGLSLSSNRIELDGLQHFVNTLNVNQVDLHCSQIARNVSSCGDALDTDHLATQGQSNMVERNSRSHQPSTEQTSRIEWRTVLTSLHPFYCRVWRSPGPDLLVAIGSNNTWIFLCERIPTCSAWER